MRSANGLLLGILAALVLVGIAPWIGIPMGDWLRFGLAALLFAAYWAVRFWDLRRRREGSL